MTHPDPAIRALQERNARVEADKAWETSLVRRGLIVGITYLTASALLWLLGNPLFYLHASVPVAGFVLSTLTLPAAKRRWLATRNSGGEG